MSIAVPSKPRGWLLISLAVLWFLSVACVSGERPAAAVGVLTTIESEGVGRIVVQVLAPDRPRYADGAPVVVNVSGFFTGEKTFSHQLDPDALGIVYVTYLWPGMADRRTGTASEGDFDYGGPSTLAVLRDVIRFAAGDLTDTTGRRLNELIDVPVAFDIVGLYAFSHSGILATNVLCHHGEALNSVGFFVGRENPTVDALYPLEPGYWGDDGQAVENPFYEPTGYTPTSVAMDYSQVTWDATRGLPRFGHADDPQSMLCSTKHPRLWGKDYWSTGLLQALLDNGSLTRETWPEHLATPEEAAALWPYRTTVDNYPLLADARPDLKVMLVFAADDHVQTAIDKPHIHQAYDGFHHHAGLWCRMNPDRAYIMAFLDSPPGMRIPDNPANREPHSWMSIESWGYATGRGPNLNVVVPLAAVAEMCDRTYYDVWTPNLNRVLGDS